MIYSLHLCRIPSHGQMGLQRLVVVLELKNVADGDEDGVVEACIA